MTKQQILNQIEELRNEVETILLDQENNTEKYNDSIVYMNANNRIKDIYEEIQCLEWKLENNIEIQVNIYKSGTAQEPQHTLRVRVKRDNKVLDMRSKEVRELNNILDGIIAYDKNYKSFMVSRDRDKQGLEQLNVIKDRVEKVI